LIIEREYRKEIKFLDIRIPTKNESLLYFTFGKPAITGNIITKLP